MSERSGTDRRRRTRQIGLRLTPDEYATLAKAAKDHDLTIPAFVRHTALALARPIRDAQ
jgi:uncharacterized protein (DUF1778 family)